MTVEDRIKQANQIARRTNLSIDLILLKLDLTHEQYRKVHPETPVSPGLALDLIEAREGGRTLKQIRHAWNLTNSQLNYALYNDNALKSDSSLINLTRSRIYLELKSTNKTQQQIARECGCSQGLVHKIAKEHGLLDKFRKKRVVLTDDQKEEIRTSEEPVTTLAKKFGVSRDTIYKYVRGLTNDN